MILVAKGVSRFPTLNTRNDITTPSASVANLRLLTSAVGNRRVKLVFENEATTGFQLGTDSPANNTNNFFIGNSATGLFPLTISAADVVALGTAGGASQVSVAATLGITCPGAGSNSERFGASALAAGSGATAVGKSASAATLSSTVLGNAASTTAGTSNIAIGLSATVSGDAAICIGTTGNLAHAGCIGIGYGVTSTAANQMILGTTVAPIANAFIGNGVTNSSPQAVVLNGTGGSGTNIAGASVTIAGGRGTGTGAGGAVLIRTAPAGGSGSSLNALATVATFGADLTTLFGGTVSAPGAGATSERFGAAALARGTEGTAVGNAASAASNFGVAVGSSASNGGTSASGSVALGRSANNANNANSFCVGNGAANTAANQAVLHLINSLFIGAVTAASPADKIINASGGSGTDNAGANLIIAGGRGTGSAAGGAIIFQSTIAGASASTARTLQEKARISNVGVLSLSQESSTQTRTVWDVTPSFVVSTDASRTGRAIWQVYDTAAREAFRIEASGTAPMIGFLGAAAVARPASANQAALTDSTTGTADGTVADVGASFNQATLNNNFADIIRLVNQLRADLVTLGLIKGSA